MSEKVKKYPMRMCVGCRQMYEKKMLVRVVRGSGGEAHIDLKGKAVGRGAYVCRNTECLAKAIKTKALERALGVCIDENMKERLSEEIE